MSVYVPILVLGGLAAAFAVFSVTMGALAGPKRWNRAKLSHTSAGSSRRRSRSAAAGSRSSTT